MLIVSDTIPIILLMKARRLELLQKLFTTVYITKAAYGELTDSEAFSEKSENTCEKDEEYNLK